MNKNISPFQTLCIGLALFILSKVGVGGVTFELGGVVVSAIGIVLMVREKLVKKK